MAARAHLDADRVDLAYIQKVVPESVRRQWLTAVLTEYCEGQTILEWLQKPPGKRSDKALKIAIEKRKWLEEQRVDQYDLSEIRLLRQRQYARRVRQRAPTQLRAVSDPRRTVELVCFLQMTLMQITDTIVSFANMKTLDIQRHAIHKMRQQMLSSYHDSRSLLCRIRRLLEDRSVDDKALRAQLLALVPTESMLTKSRAARVRCLLTESTRPIRKLLKQLLELPIASVSLPRGRFWDLRVTKNQLANATAIGRGRPASITAPHSTSCALRHDSLE